MSQDLALRKSVRRKLVDGSSWDENPENLEENFKSFDNKITLEIRSNDISKNEMQNDPLEKEQYSKLNAIAPASGQYTNSTKLTNDTPGREYIPRRVVKLVKTSKLKNIGKSYLEGREGQELETLADEETNSVNLTATTRKMDIPIPSTNQSIAEYPSVLNSLNRYNLVLITMAGSRITWRNKFKV